MKKILFLCLIINSFFLYAENVKLPDGTVYEGPVVDGLFNGFGIQSRNGKTLYEGEFKDGLYEGK